MARRAGVIRRLHEKWRPITTTVLWGTVLPVILASVLLTYKLSSIAGIHRDEAAFGLSAENILSGARPLSGFFNDYTAPMHSYVVAAMFALLGESTFSLRIGGVLFNLLSLILYFDIVRRLSPRAAVPALWLMATFPVFVVFSRISGENYSMNPFFLFGGIWAFIMAQACRRRWLSGASWWLSGLLFCLGCWNHIVSVAAVAGLGLVYLLFARPERKLLQRLAPWFLAGILVAALPKLYTVICRSAPLIPLAPSHLERMSPAYAFLNLIYTLGGDALYVRATGQVALSLNWMLPVAALAAISTLPFQKNMPPGQVRFAWALISCFGLSFLGSWIITPRALIGSRIWLLPLWFVPAIIAIRLTALSAPVRAVCLTAIVTGNLLAIGCNYFYTFQKTGGLAKGQVYVGGRFDNSIDFLDLTRLVANLRAVSGQPPIFIEDASEFRLWFLMPEARARIHAMGPSLGIPSQFPQGSLIAAYRPPGMSNIVDGQELPLGATRARYRARLSTSNYLVLQADGD
jgi:4-amino-4-deoxy-L-arabinose transferase-like glycosyltransferase